MTDRFKPPGSSGTSDNVPKMPDDTQTTDQATATRTTFEQALLYLPESTILTLSGAMAGLASGIVSCPLDVIKTKLQAQGGFMGVQRRGPKGSNVSSATYSGIRGTAQTIFREEGLRGMYRGLEPMLLGYVPTWAVYLTVYNEAQGFFRTQTDNMYLSNMYASLCGGFCSTLVTNPIWVIKTRLMSQTSSRTTSNHVRAPWHYNNTLDAARKMFKQEGLLSFYSGLTPALLGLTHVAIQFPLYEVFKAKFTRVGTTLAQNDGQVNTDFLAISLAVFLSKAIASTATYPHEVVRTRLQTQQRGTGLHVRRSGVTNSDGLVNTPRYRGTLQTCKTIFYEEGWRGFYAGLGTNLLRAIPSAMTTIVSYEYLKKTLLEKRANAAEKPEI